jgi:hypothetical protein
VQDRPGIAAAAPQRSAFRGGEGAAAKSEPAATESKEKSADKELAEARKYAESGGIAQRIKLPTVAQREAVRRSKPNDADRPESTKDASVGKPAVALKEAGPPAPAAEKILPANSAGREGVLADRVLAKRDKAEGDAGQVRVLFVIQSQPKNAATSSARPAADEE